MSEGGVAEDVVIAQGEHIDPDTPFPLTSLSVMRVWAIACRSRRQRGWPRRGCHGGRFHHQILGNRGMGQDRPGASPVSTKMP